MEDFKKIMVGFWLGMFFIYAINQLDGSLGELYYSAIEKCEAELPRDAKCKIIGIPVTEQD